MEKEIRKTLCPKCLKAVREAEARLVRAYRLKVKQKVAQVSGKIPVKLNKKP